MNGSICILQLWRLNTFPVCFPVSMRGDYILLLVPPTTRPMYIWRNSLEIPIFYQIDSVEIHSVASYYASKQHHNKISTVEIYLFSW